VRLTRLFVAALLIGAVPAVDSTVTQAHTVYGDLYANGKRWARTDGRLPWRFESDFPNTIKRDAVVAAANAWADTNAGYVFDRVGPDFENLNWLDHCVTDANAWKSVVQWIDIQKAGTATLCSRGTTKQAVRLRLDSNPSPYGWYSGTGCCPGPNQWDMWSVAAHEFGHFLAFLDGPGDDGGSHFHELDESACPDLYTDRYNARETMCPGSPGWTVQRRPSYHDGSVARQVT